MRSRSVTVISTFDGAGRHERRRRHPLGHHAGRDRRPGRAPRGSRPRRRRRPTTPRRSSSRTRTPTTGTPIRPRTSVEVFDGSRPTSARRSSAGEKHDRLLFGFAEHQMTSTSSATSTGLRRRFDQPDGRLEVNGKSGDYSTLGVGRRAHPRLHRRRRRRARRRVAHAPGLGGQPASNCRPAGTRRSCRRARSPT